jgi:acyl carrier protein
MKSTVEWDPGRIEESVQTWLTESFLTEPVAGRLGKDDELLRVLDSLQLLRMVLELENQFRITIENGELTLENLGTLNRIGEFVRGKLH